MSDTIAAISSPIGEGAISMIRLSGPAAADVAGRVFRSQTAVEKMPARVQHFGAIWSGGEKIDEGLLTVFPAPASYTGEDVVEFSGHGGMLVTQRVLAALLAAGARLAQPGEFTQRAFLHGKLDLTQAEAVMDLITAQTDLALRAAHEQLSGSLGRRIGALQERVLDTLAHVEAYIDFPEEDIDPQTGEALHARLMEMQREIADLLASAARGRIMREGVRTVIYGAPNVGKSSLLNLLLGYDRAIVSATPGTTRDSIQEVISVRGFPLRLVDTAGLHASADPVEQAGMRRTEQELDRAELILHVHDATAPRDLNSVPERPGSLRILNKIDLGEHQTWQGVEAIRISCVSAIGMAALEGAMEHRILAEGAAQTDWSVAINARHQAHLEKAQATLVATRQALTDALSPEFVAEELRAALGALGEINGPFGTEDLLGKIFSTFCIGK